MKYTALIAAALLWSAGVAWCSPKQEQAPDLFTEQVAQLIKSIKMPEEQLADVPKVLHDLELVLGSHWPELQVLQFGSTVNGLAMVGSDVDFIACLNVTAAEGPMLQQTKEIFQNYPNLFRDFHTFPGCNELFSLQHIPTGFLIDVVFNDLDVVTSTKLTKYLIHLDDRVFDLVMIVKYWAKVHRLTEERVLSSYAMTLLVIFYLQQRGVLPSVASLQNGAEPDFFKGWNKGFDEIQYKPRIEVSLYQILGGFFEYYNAFDFGNNIISTFTGRPIERKLFEDTRNVPVEYDVYKRNVEQGISRELILHSTPVIVQDPFTHFENLAKHLKLGALAKFMGGFRSAALSYRRDNESVFLANILSDK